MLLLAYNNCEQPFVSTYIMYILINSAFFSASNNKSAKITAYKEIGKSTPMTSAELILHYFINRRPSANRLELNKD